MCTSYCNTCNYCVSNCTCTKTTTTPPCTSSSGCLDTNYADCVFWRGDNISSCNITVTKGDTLEDAIKSLKDAICALTPADLDWTSFDYGCLGSYTTAQEFAEGVSAAICSLNSAVDVTPNVTISGGCSSYFSGITPGTSTLVDILDDFIVKLCALNTFNTTGSVNTSCSAGTWSTLPNGTSLKGWINWIKSNVCSLVTSVQGDITDIQTFQSNVTTFLGTTDLFDNTDCLSGSGSDDLQTTMALIKAKLCSIDSTVASLPNFDSVSVPWSTCGGTIGGSWATYTNTNTLSTQLSRIVTQLAARTYNFSGDFTVTPGACGTSVSLTTSVVPFTCLDLGTCSIHLLADVDPNTLGSGSGDKFKVFSWNTSTNLWQPKILSYTSSGGTVDIGTKTDSGTNLIYNFDVNLTDGGNVNDTSLTTPVDLVIGAPSGGTRTITLKYNSNSFPSTTAGAFNPIGALSASAYFTDGNACEARGGVAYLGGSFDWALSSTIVPGSSAAIGTVSASLIPTHNTYLNGIIIDTVADLAYIGLFIVDNSGNVVFQNASGGNIVSGTYAFTLSSIQYKL
jgi:hypothetical protein